MHANRTIAWMVALATLTAGRVVGNHTQTALLYFDAALDNGVAFRGSAASDNLRFSAPAPFTVEGWIRLDAVTDLDILFSYHEQSAFSTTRRNTKYEFGLRNGNVAAYGNNSGWVESTSATVATGTWHHLAFSVTANGDAVILFLDGEEVGSGEFAATRTRSNAFFIGSGSSAARNVTGFISRVRVWDHARDASQIQSAMHAQLTGAEPGLVAYWPLDEGSGATINDRSPNAIHGETYIYIRSGPHDGDWRHLVLSDTDTGSIAFTDSATVDVTLPSAPPSYTHVEITESADPASLTGNWVALTSMPGQVTFTPPASDTEVTLYAWLTNTAASLSVPLKHVEGYIVYTTTAVPQAVARSGLLRETAGFTVRITPESIDAGSTGGRSGSLPVDILSMAVLAENTSDDATPEAPYVTLREPGSYAVRLEVVNAVGAVALSDLCTIVIESAVDLPSNGARYVAVGNLNAESPYTTWATAAASIHDAVSDAQTADDDTIRVWPGRYTAPSNAVVADDAVNVVNVTRPLILHAVGGAADTVIDGEGRHRGLRIDYADTTTEFVLRGFTVTNGFAARGGAVYYAQNANRSRFVDTRLGGNTAIYYGGGMDVGGATLELHDSLLIGNRVLVIVGGAIYASGGSSLTIKNTDFIRNTANTSADTRGYQEGAAIYATGAGGQYRIENARFIDNLASTAGNAGVTVGAVGFFSADVVDMRNCLIVGSTGNRGGALRISETDNVSLDNCTITQNTYHDGRGENSGSAGVQILSSGIAKVHNCILYENRRDPRAGGHTDQRNLRIDADTAVLTHTCTVPETVHPDGEAAFAANHNLTDDPQFAAPDAGDFRLLRGSPCIDAGTNLLWMAGAFDLDGKVRIDGISNQVDIGAYEYHHPGTLLLIR